MTAYSALGAAVSPWRGADRWQRHQLEQEAVQTCFRAPGVKDGRFEDFVGGEVVPALDEPDALDDSRVQGPAAGRIQAGPIGRRRQVVQKIGEHLQEGVAWHSALRAQGPGVCQALGLGGG